MRLDASLYKALLFVIGAKVATAIGNIVDLGYSKYQGVNVGDGTTKWLGIRYAAPPLGRLRFAAPQEPAETKEVQDASKFQPVCLPQQSTDWTMKPNKRFTVAEDCLFLNVFAPSNATTGSQLPVMFFIQGGGFTSNSNMNFNGSDLAREGEMIVVEINYRVGPYGFLQSQEVKDAGSLNNGIKDMIIALQWTQAHIAKFGGDKSKVVVNGDSAGANRVVNGLFRGAISESASVATLRTLKQGQEQYGCLVSATGCSTSNDTLACLRSVNATRLQTPNCYFNPHMDGDLLNDTTINLFEAGKYRKVPTIFGSCTDEGTKSAPQDTNTTSDANHYFLQQAPSLSNSSLEILDDLYINQVAPVFPASGAKWRQLSNALGDIRSHCIDNTYQTILSKDGVTTYNYHYGVLDPEQEAKGFGAYHTVELNAVWGPNNTDGSPPKSYFTTNADIVRVVRGYWTSFVRNLDPNVDRAVGAPVWEEWGTKRQRMLFQTNATQMEIMSDRQALRCQVVEPGIRALEQSLGKGMRIELNGTLAGMVNGTSDSTTLKNGVRNRVD